MSLDLYFNSKSAVVEECTCTNCDNKHLHRYFPLLATHNITHNLSEMAGAAGIYKILWRPEENGILYAEDLIKPLEIALIQMKKNPEEFKIFNPINGWRTYEVFIKFVEKVLQDCYKFPKAEIEACR